MGYVDNELANERLMMYPCGCIGAFRRMTPKKVEFRAYVYQCGELTLLRHPCCIHSCMEAVYLNEKADEPIRWQ